MFSFIWLNLDSKDTGELEEKLRTNIDCLKEFQDLELCQKYMEHISVDDCLSLIVSDRLGREFIPSFRELKQVTSIYIFCTESIEQDLSECCKVEFFSRI